MSPFTYRVRIDLDSTLGPIGFSFVALVDGEVVSETVVPSVGPFDSVHDVLSYALGLIRYQYGTSSPLYRDNDLPEL